MAGSGSGFAAKLEVDIAQVLERAMNADLHGADGDIEQPGNVLVFEVLEPSEHEDFALGGIQCGQCGVQTLGVVGDHRAVRRMRRLVRQGLQLIGVGIAGRGAVPAEMVSGDLAGEMINPGGEPAFVAVRVPVFENPVEHELDEVFARGAVIGVAHEETVERPMVPLEEFAEPVNLAGAHGDHKFVVRERFHSWRGRLNHGRIRLNIQLLLEIGDHGGQGAWLVAVEEPIGREKVTGILCSLFPVDPGLWCPSMNRRTFLLRSAGLAAAGLLSRSLLRAQSSGPASDSTGSSPAGSKPTTPANTLLGPPITAFQPLRRNVGIFTGRGGTIGWLASPAALVVIDTQFPDTAAACLAGLPGRNRRMLDVVLNTHHHADHTSGNPVFQPAARTIVAQANVPKLQFAAAEKSGDLGKQVFADTTFAEAWRHETEDEVVTAQYFGPAHTNGDAVMMFEKANVVHMGDLVFNRLYPYVDRPGGASVRGWVQRLEDVHRNFPADAIYIFGHGNPKFGVTGGHADMLLQRDFLSALLAYVEKGLAAGKAKAEIVALENFPGFDDLHAPLPNRLQGNLSAAYDELTEKKS